MGLNQQSLMRSFSFEAFPSTASLACSACLFRMGGSVSRRLSRLCVPAFFRTMIDDGQRLGEIPGHIDARQAACALLGLMISIRVSARGRADKKLLSSIVRQAIRRLG